MPNSAQFQWLREQCLGTKDQRKGPTDVLPVFRSLGKDGQRAEGNKATSKANDGCAEGPASRLRQWTSYGDQGPHTVQLGRNSTMEERLASADIFIGSVWGGRLRL